MCPVGCKERSIDLKMIFWYNILFVGFLWLSFKDAYLFESFLCFKYIEGLYLNFSKPGCKENHFYSLSFGQAEASIY